jgi:hypothetical protein
MSTRGSVKDDLMNWLDEQGIQRQATPEEEDRYQHERTLYLRGMSTLKNENTAQATKTTNNGTRII